LHREFDGVLVARTCLWPVVATLEEHHDDGTRSDYSAIEIRSCRERSSRDRHRWNDYCRSAWAQAAEGPHGGLPGWWDTPPMSFKGQIGDCSTETLVISAIDASFQTASSGETGDGKITLSKVEETIRIQNQECDVTAL
jgi:hypothetical protein